MDTQSHELLALDVGTKRIGAARANSIAKIPEALTTIGVDGSEFEQIDDLAKNLGATTIILGLPRNQSGDETKQSELTRQFASKLESLGYEIIWQDESLTSVAAKEKLELTGKNYQKSDVDALAAAQILADYLGVNL